MTVLISQILLYCTPKLSFFFLFFFVLLLMLLSIYFVVGWNSQFLALICTHLSTHSKDSRSHSHAQSLSQLCNLV